MPCYPHTIATTDTFDVTLVLQDCKDCKELIMEHKYRMVLGFCRSKGTTKMLLL